MGSTTPEHPWWSFEAAMQRSREHVILPVLQRTMAITTPEALSLEWTHSSP